MKVKGASAARFSLAISPEQSPPSAGQRPPQPGAGKNCLLYWTRLLGTREQPWWVRLRPPAHGVFGGW